MIIFEFENVMHLSIFLQKKHKLWNLPLKKIHKMFQKKMLKLKIMYKYVSSCYFNVSNKYNIII